MNEKMKNEIKEERKGWGDNKEERRERWERDIILAIYLKNFSDTNNDKSSKKLWKKILVFSFSISSWKYTLKHAMSILIKSLTCDCYELNKS